MERCHRRSRFEGRRPERCDWGFGERLGSPSGGPWPLTILGHILYNFSLQNENLKLES
jgi:hypothetical protein